MVAAVLVANDVAAHKGDWTVASETQGITVLVRSLGTHEYVVDAHATVSCIVPRSPVPCVVAGRWLWIVQTPR